MIHLKKIIPKKLKNILLHFKRVFFYHNFNSDDYWKKRSDNPGESKVLWTNQEYNNCFRDVQRKIINNSLPQINNNFYVLDIGCGIGRVSKMIAEMNENIFVHGFDFSEMIAVAKKENSHPRVEYFEGSAENFASSIQYDMVVSSASLPVIRDINKLESAILNSASLIKRGGLFFMFDPYHKWSYLARAKYSSNQVIKLLEKNSFKLLKKDGAIFWPYREIYANSTLSPQNLRKKFYQGEKFLEILGRNLWSDYKVLLFERVE